MKYRVEVVQTTVLYIEADSPEEAQDIATGDYIWDEDQQPQIVMASILT